MSNRQPGFGPGITLVLTAMIAMAAARAGAQGISGGRPIEFSAPKTGEVTNSLEQLRRREDKLKRVDEQLKRQFNPFDSDSSLDATLTPPMPDTARPNRPNKHTRELEDRRRNWVFMTPDEYVAAAGEESLLKSESAEDGAGEQSLSILDKYLLGDRQKRPDAKKPGRSRKDDPFENQTALGELDANSGGTNDLDALDQSASTENALSALLSTKPGFLQPGSAAGSRTTAFPNIFGLVDGETSREEHEELLRHNARMQEFHRILDPAWQPPVWQQPADGFGSLAGPLEANVFAGSGGLPGSSPRQPLNSGPGATPSLSGALPELAPVAAPLPGVSATPPKPGQATAPLTPPTPNFQAPRRPF